MQTKEQTVPSSTNIRQRNALIVLTITAICFLAGGGWEILFNFSEWKYATFYRANNDDELTFFLLWFFYGPARATATGLLLGVLVCYVLKKLGQKNKS